MASLQNLEGAWRFIPLDEVSLVIFHRSLLGCNAIGLLTIRAHFLVRSSILSLKEVTIIEGCFSRVQCQYAVLMNEN
jgi:hypothetical protein